MYKNTLFSTYYATVIRGNNTTSSVLNYNYFVHDRESWNMPNDTFD